LTATKQILKHESYLNNNKVKKSKEAKEDLGRENTHDYIRMKESIILMISVKSNCITIYLDELSSGQYM
jgi:hypothetical protein